MTCSTRCGAPPAFIALSAVACAVAERSPTPVQQVIDGPAGRLFVDDGGGGASMPVVLIHSLAGNSGQWTMLSVTTPLNEFPSSLHRVMPVIRQEKMAGVSHWLHLDRPTEFNAVLDRFLAGIPD